MEIIQSLLVIDNTLFFVIIILQIVTMILLIGGSGKGQKREPKSTGKRPGTPGSDGKSGRKDAHAHMRGKGNNLKKTGEARGVKPQQQSKPQQSQPSAIDPMEKSLRDINLRLKNAEREQESARKKIHQESGTGPRSNGRPENQNRPQQRPPMQRANSGRDDRPPRREFNRSGPPMQEQHPQRPMPTGPEFGETPQYQAPEMAHDNSGMHEQADMQHGRRFTAKRRQLPENPEGPEETGAPMMMPPEPSFTPTPPPADNAPDNAHKDWGR